MVWAMGLMALWPAALEAREVPPLTQRVTDVAGVLAPPARARIEAALKDYEMRTGRQFAVLVVPDLEDEVIETYTMRVAEAWRLGRKPQDDGLLLLIALKERRMRIEVGYGLEGDITDALSIRVIHDVLRPAFRRGAYAEGIAQAMQVLMQAADKSPVEGLLPTPQDADGEPDYAVTGLMLLALVCMLLFGPRWLLPMLLMSMGDGGNDRGGRGGGFRGGGGGFGGGGASGGW
jgi:uncharacterized protein